MERHKLWQSSIKPTQNFSKNGQGQGLLPTPSFMLSHGRPSYAASVSGRNSGLLPLPKPHKLLLKTPLLQAPIQMLTETQRMPLLKTPSVTNPVMTNSGKRSIPYRKRKTEMITQQYNKVSRLTHDGQTSSLEGKEVNDDEQPINSSSSHTDLIKAYKTHREKLNKSLWEKHGKLSSNTELEKCDNISHDIDNMTDTSIDKSEPQNLAADGISSTSENLTYLANYLLHMKSLTKEQSDGEWTSGERQIVDETFVVEKSKHNKPDLVISNHSTAPELVSEADGELTIQSNASKSEQLKEEISNKSDDSINTDALSSPTKGRKLKIQLSNYACGNETSASGNSQDLVPNKFHSKPLTTDVADITENNFAEITAAHTKTNFDLQNEYTPFTPLSSNLLPDGGEINEEHRQFDVVKEHKSSIAVQTEFSNVFTPSLNQSCKMVQTEAEVSGETTTVSNSATTKSESRDEVDGSSSSSSRKCAKDLPYIVPVAGFYCDVCCDFFFDETSTFQHCATSVHQAKVETRLKPQSGLPEELNEEEDEEEEESMVIHRKKKKKISCTVAPSSEKRCFELDSPFTSSNQPQRKKHSSRLVSKSRVIDQSKTKPFDWNFVIPKRK